MVSRRSQSAQSGQTNEMTGKSNVISKAIISTVDVSVKPVTCYPVNEKQGVSHGISKSHLFDQMQRMSKNNNRSHKFAL